LEFAETADRFGFHGYHIAEHHSTTLGMAPSPSASIGKSIDVRRTAAMGAATRSSQRGATLITVRMRVAKKLIESD
jgi:hypothetical protein